MGYSVTCPYVLISVFHLSGDCDYIKRFTAPLVASVQCQANTEDRNWTASKIYTFILILSPFCWVWVGSYPNLAERTERQSNTQSRFVKIYVFKAW